MATTLAYRVVQTAGIGRAVSDRSEMPQHAAEDAMPTLGHELLRVHRFVVEIRFERQSPQRAVASFSDCAMPWSSRSEARAAEATTATTAPPETGSNPYERTFRMRGITSLRSPSELDRFRYVKSFQSKRGTGKACSCEEWSTRRPTSSDVGTWPIWQDLHNGHKQSLLIVRCAASPSLTLSR